MRTINIQLKMNMAFFQYCTIVILNIIFSSHICENAEILVVMPTALKSHTNIFHSVINTLATEHRITFYSVYKLNKIHENVTEKRITNKYENANTVKLFSNALNLEPFNQLVLFLHYFIETQESILSGNDIDELFRTTKTYDLFITINMISEVVFKLSHVLKVPLIQVSPSVPLPWTNEAMNNPNNLGYDVSFITPEEPNSFAARFKKFIKNAYVWLYYDWVYLPALEKISRKYFPPDTPTIKEIARNTEGLLVNYMSEMGYVRPTTPNVLEIGGLHCKPPSPLPADLEQFASASEEHGVIYFSLGSTVTDLALSVHIKTAIQNVFKQMPQRILWKLQEAPPHLPGNIKISKWFPQQNILGHNKTKLFITQGGILSLQEAAYHGVPVLILPLICDQFTNGYLVEKKGYGKMLKLNKFNEDEFYFSIQELINNPKYKDSARLVSSSIKDQPISTATKLKHWVNYIIQHRDTAPFQPLTKELSYVQLRELDIILAIVGAIIFSVASFIVAFLYLYKIFKSSIAYKFLSKTKLS